MKVHAALAAAVFAVALTVRLAFLYSADDRDWPHSIYHEGDAPVWADWATHLNAGTEFERGLCLRSPAVAYVLHWLSPVMGERNFVGYKALWCVLSAATCALLYLAALPLGRITALTAALLCTFSFGSYVLATSLNNEAPYGLLLIGILLATRRFAVRPGWLIALALGVVHGVATLFRPEHQILFGLMLVWSSVLAWRRARTPAVGKGTADEGCPILRGGRADKHSSRDDRPAAVAKDGSSAALEPSFSPQTAAAKGRGTRAQRARDGLSIAGSTVVMVAAYFAACAPWSWTASRALQHFNDHLDPRTAEAPAAPRWTSGARAYLDALPPFVRYDNLEYLSHLARQAREREITLERVRRYFEVDCGYRPEPLPRWVFVSPMGPLNFALANHPASGGGFSKAALDARLSPDPQLTLGLPSHLKLFEHGYRAGWQFIRDDPAAWLRLVGKKLAMFADGFVTGFGADNWPVGRGGVRRAVDMIAPPPGASDGWRWTVLAAIALGLAIAIRTFSRAALPPDRAAVARFIVLVFAYKLLATMLFYGYARQAASIYPVVALALALAAHGLIRLVAFAVRRRWQARPRRIAAIFGWSALAAAAVGLTARDIRIARRQPAFSIAGPARFSSQWAPNAVEAVETIEVRVGPPGDSTTNP